MNYLIFFIFIFFYSSNAYGQLSNQEKKDFLEYSKKECPIKMLKKSENHRRFSSPYWITYKKKIGDSIVKNQVLKPAFKVYCDCMGTYISFGEKISKSSKFCGKVLNYEFKKGLSKFL